MARNIEIKARVATIDAQLPRACALDDREPESTAYDDALFTRSDGRLKLRATLARNPGATGRAIEQRTGFLVVRARVHRGRVSGRGDVVGLEVELCDGEPAEHDATDVRSLLDRSRTEPSRIISGACVDRLRAAGVFDSTSHSPP
ncbi:MAG: hypothetical protein KGK18_05010 [Burkholderiales bacterium]|nr:hypothetical protein [Burkholderiales bacterium]